MLFTNFDPTQGSTRPVSIPVLHTCFSCMVKIFFRCAAMRRL